MRFLLLLCSFIVIFADASPEDNTSSAPEYSYVDEYHGYLDGKVHEWGVSIDDMVLGIYDAFAQMSSSDVSDYNISTVSMDANSSVEKEPAKKKLLKKNNQSVSEPPKQKDEFVPESKEVDEFFLTRKLLEERDKSYVRVSLVRRYNSLEKEETQLSVRARLGLGRSKKRLRLFIEEFDDESAKNIGASGEENSPSIGVDLFSKERFKIKPKYSIGFRGVDPFVRARYSYEKSFERWRLEPVQTFTYSVEDEFSETTELYLDTPTSDFTLLRFVIDRGTQSHVKGTRYDGFVQWFWKPRKNQGFSTSLGFNGSTKYQNAAEEENRVFNYLLSFTWRENIFKPWLFYEIGPGVNYHEIHDYRPNYNIYFKIDLFFGHV